jgi:AbiV family abortive infection protein
MKEKGLSQYKYKKIAGESLRNALRLHFDSILLYEYGSYPSAFQLSVLCLEEFAKAKWVDHCYDAMITNEGFPKESDPFFNQHIKFEQEWLRLLYLHPEKQFAFVAREIFDYSPKFVKHIRERKLEFEKQQAVYVGLERSKGHIDTDSRISIPLKKINQAKAKKIISLLNHEFMQIFNLIQQAGCYFGIYELDDLMNIDALQLVFLWPHRSGLKSRRWNKFYR